MFMNQASPLNLALICSFVLMASCASSPETANDTTPKNPTSVVNASYTINGGFVPSVSGDQTVYTRSQKRRIDTTTEYDSFFMSWADSETSSIFRIERNLLWMLDNDERSYRECPLSGCTDVSLFPGEASEREEDEETYESYEDRQCQVTLAANDVTVEETGNQRQMQGLDASEYVVRWKTVMEDSEGRKDTNLLQFVFWTAPPTEKMGKAWQVHTAATDNYLDAVGENNVLVRLLGRQGFKTIGGFVGDIEKTDEQAFNNWTDKLARIQGYPLSIKMEWFQRREACPEPESETGGSPDMDVSDGLDGLKDAAISLAGSFVEDQKDDVVAEWQKKPLVRYVYEVESIAREPVHDSIFMVPEDYTLTDRQ